MNRTYLRRILALEAKFPSPLPDVSHLTIDELYDLKMLIVKRFIADHRKSGTKLPLPWITEALESETPKQREDARKAAGLTGWLSASHDAPRLMPMRKYPDTADRKLEVQSSSGRPSESAGRGLRSPTTQRRGARSNRRPRRVSGG
jgi:hypothetical protein